MEAVIHTSGRPASMDSEYGPNCLTRPGDLPVLCHELTQLKQAGATQLTVLVGFHGDRILEHFKTMLTDMVEVNFKITHAQLEKGNRVLTSRGLRLEATSRLSTFSFVGGRAHLQPFAHRPHGQCHFREAKERMLLPHGA